MTHPTPEQIEAAAKAYRKHNKSAEYAGIVCRECDAYLEDRAHFERHRTEAALVAAAGAAPQPEGLTEGIADTLAYYQCRETNPKADHPSMGYHAFPEEQRAHLREQKAEAAAEIVRMMAASAAPQEPSGCSNPECPLVRAHSGPCAPRGWTPDRENLIAEGRLHTPVAVCYCQVGHPDDHPECRGQERFCERCDSDWPCLAKRATAALAVPVQVDEAKLAEVVDDANSNWMGDYIEFCEIGAPNPGVRTEAITREVAVRAPEWLRGGG